MEYGEKISKISTSKHQEKFKTPKKTEIFLELPYSY